MAAAGIFSKVFGFALSRWGLLTGLGATGIAYKQSSDALAEDMKDGKQDGHYFKQDADKFISETAIPGVKKAVTGVMEMMGAASSGIANHPDIQGAVKGAASVTKTGLNTAGGLLPQSGEEFVQGASNVASTGGQAVNTAAGFTWERASEFVSNMLPKDASGWLKTAATIGVLGAGGWGLSKATGFTSGAKFLEGIAMAPFNLVTGALGGALTPILTGGLIIGAALMFLSPTCRQFAADCVKGLYNMVTGYKPEHQHQHQHQQAPASAIAPENAPPLQHAPVHGVKLDGVTLNGVTGGNTATHVAMPKMDVVPDAKKPDVRMAP